MHVSTGEVLFVLAGTTEEVKSHLEGEDVKLVWDSWGDCTGDWKEALEDMQKSGRDETLVGEEVEIL